MHVVDAQQETFRRSSWRSVRTYEEEEERDAGGEDIDNDGFTFANKQEQKSTFDPSIVSSAETTAWVKDDFILDRANVDTLLDHVDDPLLPPLDRRKRGLAQNVTAVSSEEVEVQQWMQE